MTTKKNQNKKVNAETTKNETTLDRAKLLKKASTLFDADIVASLESKKTQDIADMIKTFESLPAKESTKKVDKKEIKKPILNLLGGKISKQKNSTHNAWLSKGGKLATCFDKKGDKLITVALQFDTVAKDGTKYADSDSRCNINVTDGQKPLSISIDGQSWLCIDCLDLSTSTFKKDGYFILSSYIPADTVSIVVD